MGLYDYIKCEKPLPETPVPPPGDTFQTKDTPDQYMTIYTITAEGHLVWRPYEMQEVPKAERPHPDGAGILALADSIRRVEQEPARVMFDGDIRFYTSVAGNGWWEYRATFREGVVTELSLYNFEAPQEDAGKAEI